MVLALGLVLGLTIVNFTLCIFLIKYWKLNNLKDKKIMLVSGYPQLSTGFSSLPNSLAICSGFCYILPKLPITCKIILSERIFIDG